ncbi:hypothetical protein K2173_022567 [Erythroxylum novogranatense]|uniref:60S ribosomal protein L2, mitochondrial n=1 Tax=Erythroxylum novogranatense TaxID=1862640 RepID=A0AAV8TJV2_9ROSI|nr:hypothetical protein K2173_022567 [Erythroxylum novogranatense]
MSSFKQAQRAFRHLTFSKAKTAGRNSAGRITSFHRGGGAKRLGRVIDVKRNVPCIGVVERIEYDPNRSSRIALVRWMEGLHDDIQNEKKVPTKVDTAQRKEESAPRPKILDPALPQVRGLFAGKVDQRKVAATMRTLFSSGSLPKKVAGGKISSSNSRSLLVDGRCFHSYALHAASS